MRELSQNIDELKAELKMVQDMNSNAEKQLLQQYDGADKQYTEALESYDTDMRERNKEKEETLVDCQEQEYELQNIRHQYQESVDEARKRAALKEIMDRKQAEQRKQEETLNKAAEFLQSHYQGMMARRDMEKLRKGKKGRKGRKK